LNFKVGYETIIIQADMFVIESMLYILRPEKQRIILRLVFA